MWHRSITIHSEPLHATSHDGILYQLDQTLLLPYFSNFCALERVRGSGTQTRSAVELGLMDVKVPVRGTLANEGLEKASAYLNHVPWDRQLYIPSEGCGVNFR